MRIGEKEIGRSINLATSSQLLDLRKVATSHYIATLLRRQASNLPILILTLAHL